jgi:hypothetical protein
MSRSRIRSLGVVALFLLVRSSIGKFVNVTVDDTFGDPRTGQMPTYKPDKTWTNFVGKACPVGTCWARPDPTRAHNQSWHDSTWSSLDPKGLFDARTVEILFEGEQRQEDSVTTTKHQI